MSTPEAASAQKLADRIAKEKSRRAASKYDFVKVHQNFVLDK